MKYCPNQLLGQTPSLKPYAAEELYQAEEFTKKFEKSNTKSIDLFLARNPEFGDIGKMAIAFRILTSEYGSKFRESMKERSLDWYSYLFDRLTDELVNKDDYSRFCENKVSFVTFNYDRSLEHFLYESLINSFNNIPAKKIKEQLNQIRIIHVFGQVSGLEWQELPSKLEYGCEVNRINVPKLIKNIRIIYEEQENPELDKAHELIRKAQHILFLGFGYAKENLDLLNIQEILTKEQKVYGTTLGLTTKEVQSIKSKFPNPSGMCDQAMDCLRLLRECF
ncbi:MAG: hypothetical protein JW837_18615 [Sedimentisphaerales bacterium]|nr:hypothetical protein [Sedimentisphaerales bacterium]